MLAPTKSAEQHYWQEKDKPSFMKVFQLLLKLSKTRTLLAILAGSIGAICSTLLITIISVTLTQHRLDSTLIYYFIVVAVLMIVSKIISQSILTRLGQQAIFDIRMELSRRILATPYRHLEEMGGHKLLPLLTDDIASITNALINIPYFCINCIAIVACLVYIGYLSTLALLFVVVFVVFGCLVYQLIIQRGRRYIVSAREEEDTLFRHIRSLLDGIKELKLNQQRRHAFVNKMLIPTAQTYHKKNIRGIGFFNAANRWGESLFLLCIGLLIFSSLGFFPLQTTILSGTALVVLYMQSPLEGLMSILPLIIQGQVALTKIERLNLSRDEEERGNGPVEPLQETVYTITLENIQHSYWHEHEETHFSLGPINLQLRSGEITFLIGGNGSGKTTLAKVLVGLYSPEAGVISLNTTTVTETNKEWYRQHFSMVFSDFHLFDQVLEQHPSKYLDKQAADYLEQLQLGNKVSIQDGFFSTTELSQGQRKRLALLVAYLEDRPVYIFDEWASDQDPVFKNIFYSQILPDLKSRGKAIMVITHDDHYFHCADTLLKLDSGTLVTITHETLANSRNEV